MTNLVGSTTRVDLRPGLVLVTVADRRLALPVDQVLEVHPIVEVSPLPGAPEVVEGLIDVRGELVAVLDLGVRFGQRRAGTSMDDRLVMVQTARRRLALHVDAAVEIVFPDAGTLRSRPVEEASATAVGVVVLDDGLVVIHDLEAFLTAPELRQLLDAMARGRGSRR
jgi:purine-binding chemotaxis protein CheW